MPTRLRTPLAPHRLLLVAAAFLFSVLSCGREITGPDELRISYARGLSFDASFPEGIRQGTLLSNGIIDFTRVRVLFTRTDGSVALDRVVDFPANAEEVQLSLDVPLSEGTGSGGEVLALTLAYINAAGDTVFRGGPTSVTVFPSAQGAPPPAPIQVAVHFTGPGSNATSVRILPETVTVTAGDAFAFTATALDGAQQPVGNAPISWRTLDATRMTMGAPGTGSGTATALRGTARIVAQLLSLGQPADTAVLVVRPRAQALQLAAGGAQTGGALTTLPAAVVVRAMATDGQPMSGVPLTIGVTTGGGSTSITTDTTIADGTLAFTWTLGDALGAQSLTVSSPGLADLVVTATATATAASQLVITQQPAATQVAGVTVAPALRVEARDASGALFTGFADSVFLAIAANPGDDTLSGTHRLLAVNGVATFDAWHLRRAGAGYTVTASAAGLTGATSTAFTVAPAAAESLSLVSGGGQVGLAGAALAQPVVVRVADGFGNPVPGVDVAFSVASGSVGSATATTDANGRASTTWTLGPSPATQQLTASATGLTGSPLAVSASLGAFVASTRVNPQLDTLTAIGATRTLTTVARDADSAVVAGVYAWVSRDPAVATVSATGLVTALTNGATWVVATEVGGTRDSARIVVEQRLATIRVTPDPRDVYLGASFQFSAVAVDGLDVPLTTQPSFTWTTASSAIASVSATGVATGVGLGVTQVRATAGAVTGVAQLTVRTPIQRIAVVRDSTGFTATDTFTITALARTRSYRAVAYDTLDAPMTGIAFSWASSNPSVAPLDSTGTATARALATANGFTAIRASAQGVTGAAALTVAQVMTAIQVTPATVEVAPTGQVALTARRLDANGYFIPGGTFTWASADAGIATVSAGGVVTGVANGGTTVTATSGAVTSAPASVTVTTGVPPRISFGRDTLAIGRSATNVPIPVYLSRPDGIAVTVNVAVADTFAFFNPASVTIPAGQTVGTANLNGRNAGTTSVFATATPGPTPWAGDTAALAVQAGVRFTSGSYSLLTNDQVSTQVLLTDPAPVGGTYVIYTYGTEGRVSISPDPAFIPQGQLAADVVIRALAAGGSTVTPVATGVSGTTSTVNTLAPTLTMYAPVGRVGAGQFRNDWYVYTPQNVNVGFPVTLTSTDTAIARVTPQATIPSNSYYAYFTVTGRVPGTVTIGATATGWSSPSAGLVVTTPRITMSGGGTLNTTSPQQTLTVYATDSLASAHWRTSALAVTASSSDESVIRVETPSVTIGAGEYYTSSLRVIPGGAAGTAWVRVTASGHTADSVLYTVVGPQLRIYQPVTRVGAGQYRPDAYVYTPNNVTAPLVVRLSAADAAVAGVPDSVIIPAGTYYAYFNLRGLTPGTSRIHATATGYRPDSTTFQVTTPKVYLSGSGSTITVNNFSGPHTLTTYAADTANGAHYAADTIVATYTSSDAAVVTVTAADTIAPGEYYTQGARVTVVGEGTAWIHVTAPGHRPDSVRFSVVRPRLQMTFDTYRIGVRQYRLTTDHYVYVPNSVPAPVTVTVTQTNPASDSVSATSLTIPVGSYYAYVGIAGLARGTDTLVFSAPGYVSDTAVVIVTSPRLTGAGIPGSATTTTPPSTVTLYVADSLGSAHYSLDTLLIAASSSNDAVLQPDSVGFRLPRGAYYVQPRIRWVGPGTASVTYRDSISGAAGYGSITSNTATVTGPSLTWYNGRPVLGMRQNGAGTSAYVQIPNAIATPLVVNLVSTDPLVASVPATVTIPAGQTFAYVDIRGESQTGTVQIQASATGYGPANTTQQVTQPRFQVSVPTPVRTTQTPQNITIYPTDANGTIHYVWEDVTVNLASSNPGAAVVDSASVTIPAGLYYNGNARLSPVAAGSTTITASDPRVESWRYADGSATVAIVTPNLFLSWGGDLSLGIGQYREDQYAYTSDNQASALTLGIAHLNGTTSTASSVVIPQGSYFIYHRITGVAGGRDSLTYSATGHNPVRGAVLVGPGRVDGIGGWPSALSTDSVAVTLYARSPDGGVRNVAAATTFDIAISGGALEARSGGVNSVVITSVTIPADAQSVTFYLRRVANGTATVTFTNANYQTHVAPVVTVSGAP